MTDQSVNLAQGGLGVGAGATVSIQSLDPEAVKASVEAQRDTAGMALAANVEALKTAGGVTVQALDTTGRTAETAIKTTGAVTEAALNTTLGLAQISSQERSDVLQTTNTALQSQQGIADKLAALASGALERSQTPDSQTTKTLLYVAGAVGVAFALALIFAFRRPSRS
ncbi:MAG: hypothetical protein PHE83_09420 [Opitutaceae bacterium]|nr:hypothetical protein [Opitutaceae bacterium]